MFGLSHGNLFRFFYAFAVRVIFGLSYVKTGKIIYTILYHMVLNFTGGVVVTLVTKDIDYDGLNNLIYDIESGTATTEQMMLYVEQLTPLLIYELVLGALSLVGIVLLVLAVKKKDIRLEAGILPPPKKHRVSNIFCTVGTAALVTAYVFFFVWSILPQQ
jgi:membrane protease YdiL (CAAX protease family)